MNGPTLVLIYQHFYPDFSAGGPVTSIANLAQGLRGKMQVKIIASNRVYSTGQPMADVKADVWSSWNEVPVWYASDRVSIANALKSLPSNSVIFLNGIFLTDYFLFPLRIARRLKLRVVISPRGMLQHGALQGGKLKKRMFINVLNLWILSGREAWHATDNEEARDITKWIRRRGEVTTIANVPRLPAAQHVTISKKPGELKLIYYSLISEKKNLLFLLDLLKEPSMSGVQLDIAGPVKDAIYWLSCQSAIASLSDPSHVRYIGEVTPSNVNELLSNYHAMALPTKGENFGHAIVESLSSFRPVLISDCTPWKDVDQHDAGFALPLDQSAWLAALTAMLAWDQQTFDMKASGAMKYFKMKFSTDTLLKEYLNLFQGTD